MADETVYKVYEVTSDTDGPYWSYWAMLFENARHPHIALGLNGEVLRAAWCEDCGIRATFQAPGDLSAFSNGIYLFRDTAGNPLLAADDTFCVAQDPTTEKWYLVVKLDGGTAISLFWSGDRCATWNFLGTMFNGGGSPVVAVGIEGTLFFAARVGANIHGRVQHPGYAAPLDEFAFLDAAGTGPLTVSSTASFGLAQGHEDASRWVGVFVFGTSALSEWETTNFLHWTRLT